MPSLNSLKDLQSFAESQIETHNIPAISIAVWQHGELHQAAAGTLNLNTGVEATTDSIFQIGSITKVMTTCLVMQLVDEGKVDLDKPIKHYLRDFEVADPEAATTITVRQLLNHSNGLAGDFMPEDEGLAGNLIVRYLDRCRLLPQVHPIGELYSYSNSAFVVAGRIVEVVRGITWYQAMQDYIYTPLGMYHAIADPKETIRFRAAMGHLLSEKDNDSWELSHTPWLPLGMSPCGASPTMSAANLITFARAHLDAGKNQRGESWFSSKAVSAMQVPQINLPKISRCLSNKAGLGWALKEYANGIKSFGHNGATSGFYASLQVFPEQNAAYAVLINGVKPIALTSTQAALLNMLTGTTVAEPDFDKAFTPDDQHADLAGLYESFDKRIDVTVEGGQISAHMIHKMDPLPDAHLILYPVGDDCYAAANTDGQWQMNLAFVTGKGQDKPGYLFDGSRLNPRC